MGRALILIYVGVRNCGVFVTLNLANARKKPGKNDMIWTVLNTASVSKDEIRL